MSDATTKHPARTECATKSASVLDAIRYLHYTRERAVRVSEIEDFTGLSRTVVSDAIKMLRDDARIIRVTTGMYEPTEQHRPPRPISQTHLPDGTVKIEVGDELLELTKIEHRTLVRLLGGVFAEAAQIATESVALSMQATQQAQIAALKQDSAQMRSKLAAVEMRSRGQHTLAGLLDC